ncbi:MAG: hypothetical protein WA821_02240 [Anaerolineales bacterium]
MNKLTIRNIVFLWLAWSLIVIGFQALAAARFQPQWPDLARPFMARDTTNRDYQQGRPYLLDPFMNNQVAFDSEYYLGIALGGYENPCLPVRDEASPINYIIPCTNKTPPSVPVDGGVIELSYAYFPLYPLLIYLLSLPLRLLGMAPIAAATLAGVLISALGTLAAMLALYDLTYESLGEAGGWRAVFYLLIFPTGFFLIQVYSDGLFLGLAFSCLAMLKRKRLALACLLGVTATLTRIVGVALVIPMLIDWLRTNEWHALDLEWRQILFKGIPLRPLRNALLASGPLIAFGVWRFSYLGFAFASVQEHYFHRFFLYLSQTVSSWTMSLYEMTLGFLNIPMPREWNAFLTGGGQAGQFMVNPQHSAYYFTEFLAAGIALIAILRCLKTHPEIAWYSLAIFILAWGVGTAQGLQRQVLAAPAVYIALARWGKNPLFDRIWTIVSILIMGLLAMVFAFNFLVT